MPVTHSFPREEEPAAELVVVDHVDQIDLLDPVLCPLLVHNDRCNRLEEVYQTDQDGRVEYVVFLN